VEKFRSQGGGSVQEFCQYGTKEECTQNKETKEDCKKLHFRKIIRKHTDGKFPHVHQDVGSIM
jgi:mRNA (2'-O-methyladenosine-N6-)-methyltransferase